MINLLLTAVYAAESLLFAPPPTQVLRNEVVHFRPKETYHFNLQAPQSCGDKPALDFDRDSLRCQFSSAGPQHVSLKICDDKETFCRNEDFTVQVPGEVTKGTPVPRQASTQPALKGFILNQPDEAVALAKKENKLLFIDFFGEWCPPCKMMEDSVLTTETFLDATKGFVRLSLDVDAPSSYTWLQRYNIYGFPSYVIVDPDLREIGRNVGGASLSAFGAWVKKEEAYRDTPLTRIKIDGASEAQRLRLGEEYINQRRSEDALTAIKGLKSRAADLISDRARVLKEKDNPAALKKIYAELVPKYDGHDGQPAELDEADWVAGLMKLDPANAKALYAGLPALVEKLKTSPDVVRDGAVETDILENIGLSLSQNDFKDEAKKYLGLCADAYAARARKAAPGADKGFKMGQIGCLRATSRTDDALKLMNELAMEYPDDYVFHFSLARMGLQLKKYPLALKQIVLAEKNVYGDEWYRVEMTKAQILLAQKKRSEARKVIKNALAHITLPEYANSGVHAAYSVLKSLLAETDAAITKK